MSNYYPPTSFYFTVKIANIATAGDSSFSEVNGLSSERDVLEIKEGGENRFSLRLPERTKYGNLELKRGLLLPNSGLANWCKTVLENDLDSLITTNDLVISLLNAKAEPLMVWNVIAAWPLKWSISSFAADKNELAIESIDLAYSYFTRVLGSGANAAQNNS